MRLLALIGALLVGCASGIAMADPVNDQQVFTARCVKCHGDGATGTLMLARRLGKDRALLAQRNDLQVDFVRHVVRNGIMSMPALTRVEVTDAELEAITRYLTRTQISGTANTRP